MIVGHVSPSRHANAVNTVADQLRLCAIGVGHARYGEYLRQQTGFVLFYDIDAPRCSPTSSWVVCYYITAMNVRE